MNILEFIQKFPDENACRLKFKEQSDKIGIVSSKYNCNEHYWLENKLVTKADTAIDEYRYVQVR